MKNISIHRLGVITIVAITAIAPFKAGAIEVFACQDMNVQSVSTPAGNCKSETQKGTLIPIVKPYDPALLALHGQGEEEFRKNMSARIGTTKTTYQGIADKLEAMEKSRQGSSTPTTILIKSSGWHNDGADATAPTCSNTGKYHITYKVWFSGATTTEDRKTRHMYGSNAKNGKCITVSGHRLIAD